MERLGDFLEPLGGILERLGGGLDRLGGVLGRRGRILAPFSSGMRVCVGSRGQVGAVWAPKDPLEAVWTVKIATDRVGREVGTAKSRQNLAGRFGLAVGVMRIVGNGWKSSAT